MAKVRSQTQPGPLTDQHLKLLDRLITACGETLDYCQKCEQCHLDVSPEVAKTREQLKIATAIKATFFNRQV